MSKVRRISISYKKAAIGASTIVVIIIGLLAVHIAGDHDRRNHIADQYQRISLPISFHLDNKSAGCDGLDFNACWTYVYNGPKSWSVASAVLVATLRNTEFNVYTSGQTPALLALSTKQNLSLYVAPNGYGQVDITVQALMP